MKSKLNKAKSSTKLKLDGTLKRRKNESYESYIIRQRQYDTSLELI